MNAQAGFRAKDGGLQGHCPLGGERIRSSQQFRASARRQQLMCVAPSSAERSDFQSVP